MDPIEKEGIERVRRRIPEADICLWVLDASDGYTAEDEAAYGEMEGKRVIAVLNKADLPGRIDEGTVVAKGLDRVSVSALTGSGLEDLKDALYGVFWIRGAAAPDCSSRTCATGTPSRERRKPSAGAGPAWMRASR